MASPSIRNNSHRSASAVGSAHLARLLDDWSVGHGPLHRRLEARLRQLVRSGRLAAGVRLPSERSLGTALNLSRNTVAAAFDVLKSESIFTSRQGDGTYVTAGQHGYVARGDDRLYTFVSREAREEILDLRSAALPGLPLVAEAVDTFPREELRELIFTDRKKRPVMANVAIARELAGWCWSLAVMDD